jgi:hypothetical protein
MNLYIDWQDASMPETPDGTTAARIRSVIRAADVFLFLATNNSMASRWCPWELGFADGVKRNEQIGIVSTRDSSGRYFGNEYMQLYRKIDQSPSSGSLYWYQKGLIAGQLSG